jgi:hypothetical protein
LDVLSAVSENGFSLDELVIATKTLFEQEGMAGVIGFDSPAGGREAMYGHGER